MKRSILLWAGANVQQELLASTDNPLLQLNWSFSAKAENPFLLSIIVSQTNKVALTTKNIFIISDATFLS
ncbi:hypothetical protein ACTWQM_03000 [Virgibacillus sp. L01]